MNLAFLTHEPFYPPSGGGSAEAVYLVRECVRRGHRVHLFCPDFQERDRVAKAEDITVHPFTLWRMGRYARARNLKYLLFPLLLERQVRRLAPGLRLDALLSQHTIAAVAAGRLRRPLRVPVVMNFLDYLTGFMEAWPAYVAPPPLLRRLKRFELALPRRYGADGVLTVSDVLADWFAETGYPRDRIRPIYFGYDAALFSGAGAAADAAAAPVVVMHGSFDRHHLGPIALDALALVHWRRPEVQFRFVGQATPTLQSFCARLRAAAPAVRIECTGFVPYAEVASRLAGAAVGIVPYEESSGGHCAFVAKIVEYLGLGLPAVSTPLRSAARYFAGEPAVTFSGFDGASFGSAVLSYLEMPAALRRDIVRPIRQRVAAELDWSVICRRAVEFVEDTVRTARGPAR